MHLYQPVGQDTASEGNAADPAGVPTPAEPNAPAGLRQLGLSLIPFTPVSFTGPQAPYAYLRLGIYGMLSYLAWSKARRLSYLCMGAAAVSFATSTSAGVWNKANGG